MAKLSIITPERLAKVLVKRGFVLDRTRGSHHAYYNPEMNVTIVIPFHKKEVGKGLLLKIINQAGLTREELIELL